MKSNEDSIVDRILNSKEFQEIVDKYRKKQVIKKPPKSPKLYRGKLSPSEETVRSSLENNGWEVLRNGWPDLLAIKGKEIRLIEVKTGNQTFTPNQRKLARILWEYLKIRVEIIKPINVTNNLQMPPTNNSI